MSYGSLEKGSNIKLHMGILDIPPMSSTSSGLPLSMPKDALPDYLTSKGSIPGALLCSKNSKPLKCQAIK